MNLPSNLSAAPSSAVSATASPEQLRHGLRIGVARQDGVDHGAELDEAADHVGVLRLEGQDEIVLRECRARLAALTTGAVIISLRRFLVRAARFVGLRFFLRIASEAPGEDRLLHMQPVLGLVPHSRIAGRRSPRPSPRRRDAPAGNA